MPKPWMVTSVALAAALLACAPTPERTDDGSAAAAAPAQADTTATAGAATFASTQTPVCQPTAPVEERASPYDSTLVALGDATAKVCYSRPAAKGRTVFGGLVPYDTLWRTGANEPTVIHLPVAATIAGMAVAPGAYALYTVPGHDAWTVIVNRSTSQWGHESQYTPAVRAQEVGRAQVSAEHTDAPVESFTIRAEPHGDDAATLVIEWENTRVKVPVQKSEG
jgi:hypothetical protein